MNDFHLLLFPLHSPAEKFVVYFFDVLHDSQTTNETKISGENQFEERIRAKCNGGDEKFDRIRAKTQNKKHHAIAQINM